MGNYIDITQKDLKLIEGTLRSARIDEWEFPKVAVFVPLERNLSYVDVVLPNLINIARRGANFLWGEYSPTVISRSEAAKTLLGSNFTHILMLDSDHEHPVDIVERLAKWVVAFPEVKVVGGLNYSRRPPYAPCAHMQDEDGTWYVPSVFIPGTLTSVDMLGTGSILINREVFEDIEPPWFDFDMSRWDEGIYGGEDTYFSKKCKDAGIDLWVDPDVVSPHIDYRGITEETFRSWYAEHGMERPKGQAPW